MNKARILFFSLMALMLSISSTVQGQGLTCPNFVVNAGNDTNLCPGNCANLNAVLTNNSGPLFGTATYTLDSTLGYNPYPFYVGTSANLASDDYYSSLVQLPFAFCFYNNRYTSCVIGSNGQICFNSNLASASCPYTITGGIPGNNNNATKNCIMGAYYDIDIVYGGTIKYATYGTAPCRTFVVSYDSVALFNCTTSYCSQQIVLHESTNQIDIYIHNKPACTTWQNNKAILGIENAAGNSYVTVPGKNGTSWTATDLAYSFIPSDPSALTTYYTWTANGTIVGTTQSITVCPTVSTNYTVTAQTVDGCDTFTAIDDVNVNMNGILQIDSFITTNPSLCGVNNGNIALYTLSPNTTYTINYTVGGNPVTAQITTDANGILTIPGLAPGTYSNIYATVGACVSNVVGPAILSPVIPPSIDSVVAAPTTTCSGTDGTVTIYGLSAGTSYSITYTYNNGATPVTATYTASGTGTVVITGAAGTYSNIFAQRTGCTSNIAGPAVIMDPPTPVVDSLTTTRTSDCFGTDGTVTLYGLTPGDTYAVTYTYNSGAPITVSLTATAVGTVTFTGAAGTYTNITATIHNCTSAPAGPATILDPNPPVISATSSTNTSTCFANDGTVTLYGLNPGATYVINYTLNSAPQPPITLTAGTAGTVTFNGPAGSYTSITVTSGACVSNVVGPVLVSDPPPIVISGATSTNPTVCGASNGTITLAGLNPNQGYTLNYTDGTGTVHVASIVTDAGGNAIFSVPADTYTNILMKQGNCVSNAMGPITLSDPAFSAAYTYAINYGCGTDTVTFTNTSVTSGPMSYIWQFNDGTTDTATNPVHVYTTQSLYAVKLIATNGACIDSTTQQIDLNHPLDAVFTVSKDTICQNSSVTFANASVTTTKNGVNPHYTWYFGDGSSDTAINPTHTYTQQGVYTATLVVQDFVPCVDSAFATITVDSIPFVTFTMSDTDICVGQSVTLVGSYLNIGNTGYNWDFGDGITATNPNPVTHAYAVAGNYDISLTANYRVCPDTTFKKKLQVRTFPGINLGPDTAICPNGAAIVLHDVVSAAVPGATYLWSTGATTYAISTHDTGLYWATVSVNGCTATDSVEIYRDCYVEIPNSFTPNGDGLNDYFFPRQLLSRSVTAFNMQVFNRWGELIFTTTNIDGRGWDGKINNVDQPTGVFVYVIDIAYANGVAEHYQGNVTLLR